MKQCKKLLFFFILSFSLLVSVPIIASATGDGNIDNGGGGLGQGLTEISGEEGMRELESR